LQRDAVVKVSKIHVINLKLVSYIVGIFLICLIAANFGIAQGVESPVSALPTAPSSVQDTIPKTRVDSIDLGGGLQLDTLRSDTSQTTNRASSVSGSDLGVKISKDGLDDIIDYGATDSSFIDLKENQIHLFGNAFVKYKKFDLKAGYIIFDFDDNEASAFNLTDALGKKIQKPDFTDGTNTFTSSGLRFNFKTSKGLIFDALTQEGEFTIHGERTKFVSKDADSLAVDDQIYNRNAIITTCTADHPHFGIRARKLKVVPNKLAIIGVSQLEIMGIPTPIILPFGFFPLVEGRSSGIIFPNNVEFDPDLGVGIREVGYYFPINDYMDLRVTGDIYTRGTHRLNLLSNYKKRYKYTGNVLLRYANNVGESPVNGDRTFNRAYSLRVTHNQDSKAHPYRSVGGTINLSTNRYDQVNTNAYENVVNNKINSNFFYRHSMPGTPFSFSAAFTHFQDNNTRKVDITLPDAKLRMNTIYPFKSKKGGGDKWYEKINVAYDAKFKNYVTATDTTLFTSEVWEDMQTGLSHKATTGTNFSLFKYINVSANADFEQFVLSQRQVRILDSDTLILDTLSVDINQIGEEEFVIDTTFGLVFQDVANGFNTVEKFGMGINAQTQLFATKRFAKGWLRGLRHTAKPSIGFQYRPDTELRYQDSVAQSANPNMVDEVTFYNPYRGGAFNPSFNPKQMALTYQITNLFEGKYWSKADSTEKKFKFLNNLNMNGNYNFAADSLKMSPLNIRGNTSFFKGITNVNLSARYNFYQKNEDGRFINETIWDRDRRPFEFDNFQLTVTNGSTIGNLRKLLFKEKKKKETDKDSSKDRNKTSKSRKKKEVVLTDWMDNFRISHQFRYEIRKQNNGRDTSMVRSHSVRLSGRINLTDQWNLSVNNISYDLVNKKFVFPQFALNRDLHCWTMQFSWTPALEVYSFFIGVKSNTLSFLKYNYGQRNSSRLTSFR